MAKDENFNRPFNTVATVNLKKLFNSWKKLEFHDYKEPSTGWRVKLGKAFADGTMILLFENRKGERAPFYRAYFYSLKDEQYRVTAKIRFLGDGCEICAIGLTDNHDALFCRQFNPDKREEIFFREISESCRDYCSMIVEELKKQLLHPDTNRFALIEKKKVKFIRIEAPYYLTIPECDEIFDSNDRTWVVTKGKSPDQYIADSSIDDLISSVFGDDNNRNDDAEDDDDDFESDDEVTAKAKTIKPVRGKSAQDELDALIGLSDIKDQISKIVAFSKMQKLARESGRKLGDVNINIAFTGNPGTAKTTVARLFAQIMKDNGILSRGKLVEAGRAEIVAAYVGQTAIKVKKLFDKAQGNVLFIDEAYSLVDSWENEYGDEAIATIVQEMENRRDDLIVIFAGYPDKMETFLARNPGLRSRVPFVVNFPDYSNEELLQIAKLEADRRGFAIESKAEGKIVEIVDEARKKTDFGNGRLCRNLVESAILSAALRVGDRLTNETFSLKESDFTIPENMKSVQEIRRIGFTLNT